jgi:hypothetical protein
MTMYDLDLLTDKDLSQNREGAEYSRKSRASINDPVWQMVDLYAIRKIPDACPRWRIVGMGDYNHAVATVYQFLMLSALSVYMIHQLHWRNGTVDNAHTDDSW